MAVSDGMMGFARGQILERTSVQVITVASRTIKFERGRWVQITDYPIFSLADVDAARRRVRGADAVTMTVGGQVQVRYRGVSQDASVTFGTEELPDFVVMEIGVGRFFSRVEATRNAPVIVLNYALARELAPERDPYEMLGESVVLERRILRVIGILARDRFEERDSPSFAAYAPLRIGEAVLRPASGARLTPSLQLLAPSVETVMAVRDATIDWLASRYLRWNERVRVTVGLEQLKQMEQGILLAKLFIGSLVGISLVVGGIGIMNVLLASVTERTREIGIRKAIGARRTDIRTQFLAESVAIAVAGTGIGLLLGFLLAVGLMAAFRSAVGVDVFPVVSLSTVLLAILSSSLVGLVFGTYPARRAANLAPIEAIAHE